MNHHEFEPSLLYIASWSGIYSETLSQDICFVYLYTDMKGNRFAFCVGKNREVKCFFSVLVSMLDKTKLRVSTLTLSYI